MSHYQGPYDGPPAQYPGSQGAVQYPDPTVYPGSQGGTPYPGPAGYPGPQGGPQFGAPYPGAYPVVQSGPIVQAGPIVQSGPKYRGLRRTAQVSVLLMGLTSVAAVIQSIVLWRSYSGVKRFIYLLVSEDEYERGAERIAHTGPLLDLVSYLFLGTGIAFLIWLWQARENTEILKPGFAAGYQGGYNSQAHRHAQGWTVGGWICPIVQFWYPLQIVQDVVTASEPPDKPGVARSGEVRSLLYGWWACWTAFWVILVGGGGFAGISFIVWLVRLVDQAETAEATDGYVDIYDMQTFMVRVALGVNIGFTIATIFLIAAAVTSSLLLFRVTAWQQSQADARIPPPPPGWAGSQDQATYPTPEGQPGYPPEQPGGPGQSAWSGGQWDQAGPQQPGYLPPGPPGPPQSGYFPPGQPGKPQSGYFPPGPPQYAPRPLPGFTTQPGPRFPSHGSQQQQSGNSEPPSQ